MRILSRILANGDGLLVKKDPKQARRLLLKAANAGEAQAQQRLGKLHFKKKFEVIGDYGSFDQDEEVCIKWLKKAADQGSLEAYYFLSKMAFYRISQEAFFRYESITAEDVFKYCSIIGKFAVTEEMKSHCYFVLADMYDELHNTGTDIFELGLVSPVNLSIYWAGKFQEFGFSNATQLFSNILVSDAGDAWYPNSAGIELPGRSFLPLVKRITKMVDNCNCEERCTTCTLRKYEHSCIVCKNEDRKNLKVCSGCNVFHYCDIDCQKKHWYAGHKKECKKKHWIESFFPNL